MSKIIGAIAFLILLYFTWPWFFDPKHIPISILDDWIKLFVVSSVTKIVITFTLKKKDSQKPKN
jgi:hypothetical protein